MGWPCGGMYMGCAGHSLGLVQLGQGCLGFGLGLPWAQQSMSSLGMGSAVLAKYRAGHGLAGQPCAWLAVYWTDLGLVWPLPGFA
jgi:hypothetical protein